MKRILITITLLCTLVVQGQSEVPENCRVQLNKFQKNSSNGSISYSNLDLSISFVGNKKEIDSIIQITNGNDTIDRFKDNQIEDFEETFPVLGIIDYQVLLRANEIYDYQLRKSQYPKLEHTFAELSPHLFGVFSEGHTLIKCSKGYNFIDKSGNLLFECFFENATNFIDRKAKVKYSGKWHKINAKGKFYPL